MSFLAPFFLWLIPLISIPTLIHLWNQRRVSELNFSTLTFLKLLKKDSIRKVQLLEIILLIIRTIIILLIVLMISRPVISGLFSGWIDNPSSTITAILIDDSFSMSGQIENNSYNDRINFVLKKINSILDYKQIVILGTLSEGVIYFGDGQTYLNFDHEIDFTYKSGEFGKLFNQVLDTINTDFVNKEMFIISDFNSNNFEFSNNTLSRLDSWNIFTLNSGKTNENLVIKDVIVENKIIVSNQPIMINTKVNNIGNLAQNNKMLTLAIDGLDVAQQIINLNPNEEKLYSFKTSLSQTGIHKANVYLENDDQVGGNNFNFILNIPDNILIGIFSFNLEDISYIINAFDALNNPTQVLSYVINDISQLLVTDLIDFDIILFNGIITDQISGKLNSFLENGKHLMILPSKYDSISQFNSIEIDCIDLDITVESDSYKEIHSDFKIEIDDYAVSHILNLNHAKPKFFHNCSISGNGSEFLVLEDGSIVWMRQYINNSILDVLSFQFKPNWTNIPILAGFLPFIHEWIYESVEGKPESYLVGDIVSNKIINQKLDQKITLIDENNFRKILPINELSQSVKWMPEIPGFYQIEIAGKKNFISSANIHPKELLYSLIEPNKLSELLPNSLEIDNVNNIINEIKNAKIGKEITHYFVLFICIFLFFEMSLAQLKKRQGKNY